MNEALAVNGDAHMQFPAPEMHENKIARFQVAAPDDRFRVELFERGTRHANTRTARCVYDEPAAVEAAGRCAAESIGLAQHGQSEFDHDGPGCADRRHDAG